jgi:hypothetical protein
MDIPIISNKPKVLPKELREAIDKLDLVSSLMLMGILLEHSLNLCGLHKQTNKGIK